MNERAESKTNIPLSIGTAHLIRAHVKDNTLKTYRHAPKKVETWLGGRDLADRVLAENIAELHGTGKSPAMIAQAVAAAIL